MLCDWQGAVGFLFPLAYEDKSEAWLRHRMMVSSMWNSISDGGRELKPWGLESWPKELTVSRELPFHGVKEGKGWTPGFPRAGEALWGFSLEMSVLSDKWEMGGQRETRRETERDKEGDRERQGGGQRETRRETERDKEGDRERQGGRQRDKEGDRERTTER